MVVFLSSWCRFLAGSCPCCTVAGPFFSVVRLLGGVGVDGVVRVEVLVKLQVECLGGGLFLR